MGRPRSELFAPVCELQLPSHCGPCSLSACLFVLGISATQRELARAAGRPVSVFVHGVDERGLRRAARAFGVKSEFLMYVDISRGREFATRLRQHLKQNNPAILLCRHFEHWIAVIGYVRSQRKFIVVDPKEQGAVFSRWSDGKLIRQSWNRKGPRDEFPEPDQYFAILLSRRDGHPGRWQIDETWLRLCERGSADTAEGMASDLAEIARATSPDERAITDGPCLADVLHEYEETIIDSITHWGQGSGKRAHRGGLRVFYRDYTTIARSTGIRIAPDADRELLVAQLTALLSSYWWGAKF